MSHVLRQNQRISGFRFFQAPWECLDSVGIVGVFDEVVLGTKVLPLSC